MTSETRTSFLGITVEGDINRDARGPQRPLSELEPLLRAVLDDPYIREFGWDQYTPYFNDGETCYFRVNEMWVLTVDDPPRDEVEDTYEYHIRYSEHPTLGTLRSERRDGKWVSVGYEGSRRAEFDRARALADALDSSEFDAVLLDAFGDHADVTISRSGITVEHYDHD